MVATAARPGGQSFDARPDAAGLHGGYETAYEPDYGGGVLGTGRFVAASVTTLALALAACTPAPPRPARSVEPVVLSGWVTVDLPRDLIPATVAAVGSDLVVGGFVDSGDVRAPALARGSADDASPDWVPVPLQPSTPYGRVASLVSLAGAGRSVTALGAAHGGAHANFRWTVWTGTPTGVADRPQTFETFGGQEAGTLLAVAQDRRGPLIIGTWQGAHGLDGAIWRAEGHRWVRQPTPPSLVNSVDRQMAPRTATGQPDGSVAIDGSVIDLRDGVHQAAAVWRGSGGDWLLSELPDPGRRSEAWSTSCAGQGPDCATVGSRDGTVAVWTGDGRADLPAVTVADADVGVLVRRADRLVVAVSTDGRGRLLVGHDGGWRLFTAPDGVVRAAVLVGTRLYLVSGPEGAAVLSVRDLADVLAG